MMVFTRANSAVNAATSYTVKNLEYCNYSACTNLENLFLLIFVNYYRFVNVGKNLIFANIRKFIASRIQSSRQY